MDASAALSELVALSTQVVEAVVTGTDGSVEAAHATGDERAAALASAGAALLDEASALRAGPAVERVHVDLERGSVAAARHAGRTIVATTVPEPAAGLLAFDLRATLRRVAEPA